MKEEGAVRSESELPGKPENRVRSVVPDPQDLFELDDAAGVLGQGPARIVDTRLAGAEDYDAEDKHKEDDGSSELDRIAHLSHPDSILGLWRGERKRLPDLAQDQQPAFSGLDADRVSRLELRRLLEFFDDRGAEHGLLRVEAELFPT